MPQAVDEAHALVERAESLDLAKAAAVKFSNAHQGAAEKTAAAVVKLLR
jgi:hypothetical protein